MSRLMAVATALLLTSAGTSALAGEIGPACRVSTVVDEMTRQIRGQDYYAFINPRLITEQSTAIPNVVECNVCVQTTPYEMPTFGPRPVRTCVPRNFHVQILSRGFVVGTLSDGLMTNSPR